MQLSGIRAAPSSPEYFLQLLENGALCSACLRLQIEALQVLCPSFWRASATTMTVFKKTGLKYHPLHFFKSRWEQRAVWPCLILRRHFNRDGWMENIGVTGLYCHPMVPFHKQTQLAWCSHRICLLLMVLYGRGVLTLDRDFIQFQSQWNWR